VRPVDKSKFDREEAAIISTSSTMPGRDNWGFVPFTERDRLYRQEVETARPRRPDHDRRIRGRAGRLHDDPARPQRGAPGRWEAACSPLGWAKLLLVAADAAPSRTMRVPLMGVLKKHQASRLASQLAFMMIEYIRRAATTRYGASAARSAGSWTTTRA
jgi:hypothetical protein